jgi:hypothetical protein
MCLSISAHDILYTYANGVVVYRPPDLRSGYCKKQLNSAVQIRICGSCLSFSTIMLSVFECFRDARDAQVEAFVQKLVGSGHCRLGLVAYQVRLKLMLYQDRAFSLIYTSIRAILAGRPHWRNQ